MAYRIEITPDRSRPVEQRKFDTLREARAALKEFNGGELYGSFDLTEGYKGEGWNLSPREGCNTAVIVPVATLRAAAREMVRAEVERAARLGHEQKHHKLHVWRDGTVDWRQYINTTDSIIDRQSKRLAPVYSVITVGTGTYLCNCSHCDDPGYESRTAAILDAVAESDLADTESEMLTMFAAIPQGYFDDERAEEDPR